MDDTEKECCVCYEVGNDCQLKCQHNLCFTCLLEMNDTICPYCRQDIESEEKDLSPYLKFIQHKSSPNVVLDVSSPEPQPTISHEISTWMVIGVSVSAVLWITATVILFTFALTALDERTVDWPLGWTILLRFVLIAGGLIVPTMYIALSTFRYLKM